MLSLNINQFFYQFFLDSKMITMITTMIIILVVSERKFSWSMLFINLIIYVIFECLTINFFRLQGNYHDYRTTTMTIIGRL